METDYLYLCQFVMTRMGELDENLKKNCHNFQKKVIIIHPNVCKNYFGPP